MSLTLLKATALAVAVGTAGTAAGTAGRAALTDHSARAQVVVRVYIVRPGDTLAKIAGEFCGSAADYPALAQASGIPDPNIIYAGQRIILSCGGGNSSSSSSSSSSSPPPASNSSSNINSSGSSAANGQAVVPGAEITVYSYVGLERLWVQDGGSSSTANVAACIAEKESGGNIWATGKRGERGLWQIALSHGALSTYDPYGNAQAAVAISGDGTNWSQWTTAQECGV